jgi:hypothetical protein
MSLASKPARTGPLPGTLALIGFAVLLAAVATLTSFSPILANVPINVVAPVLVLLCVKSETFEKIKLVTLVTTRLLIVLPALALMRGDLYVTIVLGFLVVNILEAAIADLVKRRNWYNFAAGLALAGSVFAMRGSWHGTYYTLQMPGLTFWIASYTLWNWLFVTGEFSPSIGKLHIGVLAAPIAACAVFADPGLWMIMRSTSLTFAGTVQLAYRERIESGLAGDGYAAFVERFKSPGIRAALMVVCIALALAPLVLRFAV